VNKKLAKLSEKKDYRAAWLGPITKHKWDNFLKHTFNDPTREKAYKVIIEYILKKNSVVPLSFDEIGFGQCLDFKQCFQLLHDKNRIKYTGYEITKQFVDFAKEEYPDYQFKAGGFLNLTVPADITYTRHTLEHQHPEIYEKSLIEMLKMTKHLCIIVWFQAPRGKESFFWAKNDGFENTGAWVNIYHEAKIDTIIKSAGFKKGKIITDINKQTYILERINDKESQGEIFFVC